MTPHPRANAPHHINPGPDTTINPIITNDTYREQPLKIVKGRKSRGMNQ
jgi:hypothetical protein